MLRFAISWMTLMLMPRYDKTLNKGLQVSLSAKRSGVTARTRRHASGISISYRQ